MMKNAIFALLAIMLILSNVRSSAALTAVSPIAAEATRDSKPATLSLLDQVWLSTEPIIVNSLTRVNVLVNRVTKKVEYVWSYKYNRYVRPKLSMPNIQSLYDSVHSKGK